MANHNVLGVNPVSCVFMDSLVGVFAGGVIAFVITFLVSRHYYQRASKELRDEVEKLRRLNILIVRILDEANLLPPGTKTTKDEAGNYTGGFTHELSGALEGKMDLRAVEVITDTPEQEAPSEEKGPRQE